MQLRRRRLLVPTAAAALAALAAGCGSSNAPRVANVFTATTATTVSAGAGPVAFAACMRAHGIPSWPDPMPDGGFDKTKIRALGVTGSRIRAIQDRNCGRLIVPTPPPQLSVQQQRTQLTDERSFARCMRRRGVPGFPDPDAHGQLSVEMVQAQGIDVHATSFLRVVRRCLPASHGGLTAAKVREALTQTGG